jgi:hypothetical protein
VHADPPLLHSLTPLTSSSRNPLLIYLRSSKAIRSSRQLPNTWCTIDRSSPQRSHGLLELDPRGRIIGFCRALSCKIYSLITTLLIAAWQLTIPLCRMYQSRFITSSIISAVTVSPDRRVKAHFTGPASLFTVKLLQLEVVSLSCQ